MAKKPSSRPGTNNERIKAELRVLIRNLEGFRGKGWIDESLIRHALRNPQPRTERLIADTLGTTAPAFWLDRYTNDVLKNPHH